MHGNPTATRSLCCRSRVEWLLPLHSAGPSILSSFSFFSHFSLPLSPFSFCTWLHSRYIVGTKYGALSEKDERIAFHYVQGREKTNVRHVASPQVKVASHGTHARVAFPSRPGAPRKRESVRFTDSISPTTMIKSVKSKTPTYLDFIASEQTVRATPTRRIHRTRCTFPRHQVSLPGYLENAVDERASRSTTSLLSAKVYVRIYGRGENR